MQDLKKQESTEKPQIILSSQEINTKEDYNNIPVSYCKHCLSLAIYTSGDVIYCDKCGSVEIVEGHIEKWEGLHQLKYGHKFIRKENGEGRKTK